MREEPEWERTLREWGERRHADHKAHEREIIVVYGGVIVLWLIGCAVAMWIVTH